MRNIFLLIAAVIGISLGSCSKKETDCGGNISAAPENEVEVLEQYLKSNNIQAQKNEYGFYYTIEKDGVGEKPSTCNNVTVSYRGWLTNGYVFDEARNISFDLKGLIRGWQAGIPLIAKEGKITLYLPPSLGYGTQGNNKIPANSILIFSIELVRINN